MNRTGRGGEQLIPKYGGYRQLKSFQTAQLDDFPVWVAAVRENGPEENRLKGPRGRKGLGEERPVGADLSIVSVESFSSICPFSEIAANGVHEKEWKVLETQGELDKCI